MPIYEFKCLKCNNVFELLMINRDAAQMRCPHCQSEDFERVISRTSYAMGSDGTSAGVSRQTRNCSGGSCTTYDISGHGD